MTSKFSEEWEPFNPIIREGVQKRFLATDSSSFSCLYDKQKDDVAVAVPETTEILRRPSTVATSQSGFFKATEGTPRPKRKREDQSTREQVELQIGQDLSRVASAGRWILSQLSRIPVVGHLISPSTDGDQRSVGGDETRLQGKRRRESATSEGLMQSIFGVHSAGRSPETLESFTMQRSASAYTPECQRLQLEFGMVKDEAGSVRSLTATERRVIKDLPTYSTAEEQLADLNHTIEFRRSSKPLQQSDKFALNEFLLVVL